MYQEPIKYGNLLTGSFPFSTYIILIAALIDQSGVIGKVTFRSTKQNK